MTKAKNMYVPAIFVDELLDLKREDEIFSLSEAFKQAVKYIRVGRELDRMRRLNWKKLKQPPEEFKEVIVKDGS